MDFFHGFGIRDDEVVVTSVYFAAERQFWTTGMSDGRGAAVGYFLSVRFSFVDLDSQINTGKRNYSVC
jgi:hypothetical protein